MAPSLIASYLVASSLSGDNTALVTPSFTPSNGELIVAKTQTWDKALASGAISGGGLTYTPRVTANSGSFNTYGRIDTTVVSGSPGSMTVTSAAPGVSSVHSMLVERWGSAQLAATPATNALNASSDGAPSSTITTVANDSIVSWLNGDAQSRDPAGRAYRSGATEEGLVDGHTLVNSVQYYAWQAAVTLGSQTYGMTAPSNQRWQLAAIEIQVAAAAATWPARQVSQYGSFL